MTYTHPKMPSVNIIEHLLPKVANTARLRFWIQTHTSPAGERYWRKTVLRECLLDPENDLNFTAIGVLL